MQDLDVNSVAGYSAVLNGLIVNHARLQTLATVPPSGGGSDIGAMMMFLMRMVIVLVIHVALLFPMLAMAFAFAVRIPVLWLTIAFMPFAMLKFVLPSEYTMEYPEKIWSNFLHAVFLPAVVGVPLTIGFILVNAGANMIVGGQWAGLQGVGINLGPVSDFYELLWLGIALGVMWVGVFAALEKMDLVGLTGKFADKIKGVGETLGSIAVKAPLSVPIIPGVGNILNLPSKLNQISYGLSNSKGGVAEVYKSLKGGGGVDTSKFATSAANHFNNADSMTKLDQHIVRLTDAVARNSVADKQTHINAIKSDFNIDIDNDNPVKSLKSYADELKKKGANATAITGIETKIDTLRTELAKPRP